MGFQQAEGWNLWKKSMDMRRQTLIRTIASVPRRDRIASILAMLLTGTLLLGTSAFSEAPQKAPELVSCPEGYNPTAEGDCLRCRYNSKKFRACLAESTKAFERMYEQCTGTKRCSICRENPLLGEDSPPSEFSLDLIAASGITAELLFMEALVRGRVSIKWGAIGFLAGAVWETAKLLRDYPEWSGDLDKCLDIAD